MKSFNCQFIEQDADLELANKMKDVIQDKDKPFVPEKTLILVTPHKETLWKKSILLE